MKTQVIETIATLARNLLDDGELKSLARSLLDEPKSVVIGSNVSGGKPARIFNAKPGPKPSETSLFARITSYAKGRNRNPITTTEFSRVLGADKNYLGTQLYRAVKEGVLHRTGRGVYIYAK